MIVIIIQVLGIQTNKYKLKKINNNFQNKQKLDNFENKVKSFIKVLAFKKITTTP